MQAEIRRRGSKQRRAVLNAVRTLANHPTADMIFMETRSKLPGISLSTVYRNLGILVEEGELTAITGAGGEVHYDHTLSEHCHATCRKCGRVLDVHVLSDPVSAVHPVDVSGFEIEDVIVTFTGVCSDCRERKGQQHAAEG